VTFEQIIERLEKQANPDNVEGMARYGIAEIKAYGLNAPALREMAREIGRDQSMARRL